MMSGEIAGELQVAAAAVCYGAVITLVYDLLRIFRRVITHGNFWIGVEDLIFWIWTSLWIFSVLYRENDGSFRMYTILAMVLGMVLYHKTISEPLVVFFGKILKKLVNLFIWPIKRMKIYISFFGNKLKKYVQGIIIKINHQNR